MTTVVDRARPETPARFVHSAFLYANDRQYVDGLAPFIVDGVDAGDMVLVVAEPRRLDLVRGVLGDRCRDIELGNMLDVGRNPARIIPVWQDFVDRATAAGRGARGVGEPVHLQRSSAELDECVQHESLLDLAFEDGLAWSLVCPYDTSALPGVALDAAHRSHRTLAATDGRHHPSTRYHRCATHGMLAEPVFPPAPTTLCDITFTLDSLRDVRRRVVALGSTHGIATARLHDLELAVSEIATNSIRHGGGGGRLRVWLETSSNIGASNIGASNIGGVNNRSGAHTSTRREVLVCELTDAGWITDPLVGRRRPSPSPHGGYGLWLANSTCDLVQLRSSPSGTVVRLHVCTSRAG